MVLNLHICLDYMHKSFRDLKSRRVPGSISGIPEKRDPKQRPGQGQRAAQAAVEYGDKHIRRQPGRPQPDAAAHHHCHDAVGLNIKEVPQGLIFLGISLYPFGMLYAHLEKHQPESAENCQG